MAVVSLGITTLKHTKLRLEKDTKKLENENCEDHCKENSKFFVMKKLSVILRS